MVLVFLGVVIYLAKLFSSWYGWGLGLELLFVVLVALIVGILYSVVYMRFR